ncbi:MAG: hypothetical protein AB4057_20675 [Crocosphaera sp.]|uniref:hypothetical protein n=1 Tax=Crocosphaera sp. TaxID=2729996 RepID=UPI002637DE97|nr:hypothetical protein [Crocosphaera sp.]MDJ0579787.1 hypothetical protein [Crocosphaera sp.]
MKKKTAISFSLTVTTFLTTIQLFTTPAQANFGDFLLGVGATLGVGAIIEGNRADAERRYRPVPPEQEYFRGIQDGTNGANYDNPRNSLDYDRGYQEGLRRRRR